jgi:acetyl-CoA synthetase
MTMEYAEAVRQVDAVEALKALGLRDGMLNACATCCDRHDPHQVALYCEDPGGSRAYTFGELRALSARFANVLISRGIGPGDRVAALLPRTIEIVVSILGTWRVGAVYQPLFTAFGPKAIEHRCQIGNTRLVVTDPANQSKLEQIANCPPVLLVETDSNAAQPGGFWEAMNAASADRAPHAMPADAPFMMMCTSGTTGLPKGVMVPLRALASMVGYLRHAVGLLPQDRYWNIADPGWAYGLYYAIAAPLAMGHATLLVADTFTVERAVGIVQKYRISNLCGAPTAYRRMMAQANVVAPLRGLLRAVSSAGEPLNPEVIRWFSQHLDCTIHDHYGQTELGMVLCNHHGLTHPIEPGTTGLPLPGFELAVLDDVGNPLPMGSTGVLAVKRSSAYFWFGGYWQQDTPSFVGDYYKSGDVVQSNADATFSFVGRDDDIITSAGYRIGPFDVESALIEHSAVLEAAAIGIPDAERTEIVKAFIVLKPTAQASEALAAELKLHVRERLSAHAYPREIEFIDALPKTPSGKVQRFLLRTR